MKRVLQRTWIGAMAAAWVVTVTAQAPANHAAIEKTITDSEERLSAAFARGDVATMKLLLADEAMSVNDAGTTAAADLLDSMPTMQIAITNVELSDFRFVWADSTTVVSTYTWTGTGTIMGQPVESPSVTSTVWTKRGDKWVAVFHAVFHRAAADASKSNR